MCTVSWLCEPAGYHVFFNRDERPTRAPAHPPALGETAGVRWAAPLDGDHLGTWIAANHFGLGLALLNRYEESPVPGDPVPGRFVSRGLLLRSLLDVSSLGALSIRLAHLEADRYQPFSLLGFALGEDARLFRREGPRLAEERRGNSGLLLTSSGSDQRAAARARGAVFAAAGREAAWTPERMAELHRSHLPARGPCSVCMHRDDAATVSFTHLEVTRTVVSLRYTPGPPCQTPPGDRLRLAPLLRPPENTA